MDDAAELKVTLYAIWRIEHIEGHFRALCETDFEAEALGMGLEDIQSGLRKSVERGDPAPFTACCGCLLFPQLAPWSSSR